MKLKSLTLTGFKSFAEKTTFDFHDGVTCVVGPNGCGKSNVVDAVKWVLGEQSAKSLRGGEMMDVIFNGTPQRRSAGFAEVVLAFEDATGVLARGDPEAKGNITTVGRRLYRTGESEYLINKQVVRLKDVRDMFMDTGIGVGAYSLIEQGKVETFLQASAAERRSVFDEAAGISRYKARKREALRRLERVDQNLLRLTDILGEVQKRLRSIKYQAGKARRYQEHSARLNELRSLFSLAEYHRHKHKRQELQARCDGLTDNIAAVATRIGRLEAARTAAEAEIADLDQTARSLDSRIAEASARASACQQRADMLSSRADELADAIASDTSRCEHLEAKIENNRAETEQHRQRLRDLGQEVEWHLRRKDALAAAHAAGSESLQKLRARLDDEKNGTIDLLRRTAQLHNEINTHSLRQENLHTQRQRLAGRAEQIARSLEDLLARRAALQAKLEDVESVTTESERRLAVSHERSEQLAQTAVQVAKELSEAEQAHSGLLSRRDALEEMQSRFEGVGAGVRQVLTAAKAGRFAFIRGILGEFIEADVSRAHVVEAALAGAEQRLVADRLSDVLDFAEQLKELLADTDGVELICLDQVDGSVKEPSVPLPEGAIARAADWVRRDPILAGVVEALLGSTLVVESLSQAFEIADKADARWRFVTLSGEVLEPDGRVRIGSVGPGAGMVWRKSELAELARRLDHSQHQLAAINARIQRVRAEQAHQEQVAGALRTAIYEANTERVEIQTTLEQLTQQIDDLRREAPLLDEEVRQLAEEIQAAVRAERQAKEKAAELEALGTERESEIARLKEAHSAAAKRQEALTSEKTATEVALAEAQQKRAAAEENLRRLERLGEGLAQELTDLREQIDQARQRRDEALSAASEARAEVRSSLEQKAAMTREAEETAESRRSGQQRLEEIREQLTKDRKSHEELSAQANELRIQLGEVEVRIENIISRTADELGMDLLAAYADYTHDDQRDWDAVQAEIGDLRGKIERLGNVNLDAITEQDELIQREKFLADQIQDVRGSQRQLTELIKRINVESRRRFEEAFTAVRANFNELFRKLFGGGKADVLLTNPDDSLESGIEIVARPPGKELRSITLLSGGEKTMTALALLFSFFKARPSPFCFLDEVDAALDEANTERFVRLVQQFLGTSQFVVVSHAKRTIAMANHIYGVTMQEPGVSRQISVRFEEAERLAEPARQAVRA